MGALEAGGTPNVDRMIADAAEAYFDALAAGKGATRLRQRLLRHIRARRMYRRQQIEAAHRARKETA